MSNMPVSQYNAPQKADQRNWQTIILTSIFSCFGTATLFVVGLVVLLFWVAVSFQESQQNNQIVRPDPNAPPAPVVPALPDLIAELSRAKTACEGRVIEAKDFIRHHRIREREVRNGQRHYTEVKSELNGVIDYLRSGLVVRFTNDDPRKINQRFKTAGDRMNEFFTWVDALERPKFGAADPLDAVREMYRKWLDAVRKANDEAIEQLREDLDRCRLKDWQDVK